MPANAIDRNMDKASENIFFIAYCQLFSQSLYLHRTHWVTCPNCISTSLGYSDLQVLANSAPRSSRSYVSLLYPLHSNRDYSDLDYPIYSIIWTFFSGPAFHEY